MINLIRLLSDVAHEAKFNDFKNKTKYIDRHVSQIIKLKNSGIHVSVGLLPTLIPSSLSLLPFSFSLPPIMEYTAVEDVWPVVVASPYVSVDTMFPYRDLALHRPDTQKEDGEHDGRESGGRRRCCGGGAAAVDAEPRLPGVTVKEILGGMLSVSSACSRWMPMP